MRTAGTSIWSQGDTDAFTITDPVDTVLDKIEAAPPGAFVALQSRWTHQQTGEQTTRTVHIRADHVWAITPYLTDDD